MNGSPSSGSYVSAHRRANITKILLIVGAAVSAASILVVLLEFAFPPLSEEDELGDNPGGLIVALLEMGLGSLQVLVYIATVVFFLMWLYRSYQNLPALGTPARNIGYSSGWAVGSFFIPFVNLFVPYRAMKELWQKSAPGPAFLMSDSPGAIFPLWWLFWLVSNFAGNACFRLSFREDVSREAVAFACVASDAVSIIAAIFAIAVVAEINRRQEETSKSLGLKSSQPPLPPPPTGFEAFRQTEGQMATLQTSADENLNTRNN